MESSELSPILNGVLSSSVFDVYDELLVPLTFQVYADDMARRLTDLRAGSILEVAAGTGAVTRALAASLPDEVAITATDVVQEMIERARRVGTTRPVAWEQADAMELPYESESFDVVVCQFGAMFFDPKRDAFAEARRVLRPGGRFLFSVWDGLERNEFAAVVNDAVKAHFRDAPSRFLAVRRSTSRPRFLAGPRCVTRLRVAVPTCWPAQSRRLPPRSRSGSGPQICTAGCARSSSTL